MSCCFRLWFFRAGYCVHTIVFAYIVSNFLRLFLFWIFVFISLVMLLLRILRVSCLFLVCLSFWGSCFVEVFFEIFNEFCYFFGKKSLISCIIVWILFLLFVLYHSWIFQIFWCCIFQIRPVVFFIFSMCFLLVFLFEFIFIF